MFNETSYPPCGLGDAAAVQRRLDAGKRVKQAKIDKFGLTVPEGYSTLPLPKVKNKIGIIPTTPGGRVSEGTLNIPDSETPDPNLPATDDSSGGGFDLGGIFSAIPLWGWAILAYFLLKKR